MTPNRLLQPQLEREYGKPLEQIILDGYVEHGSYSALAKVLGCHILSLSRWAEALGLKGEIEELRKKRAENRPKSWQSRVRGKGGNRNFVEQLEQEIGVSITDALTDAFKTYKTQKRVAEYFQVSEKTIANWINRNQLGTTIRNIRNEQTLSGN